MENQNGLPLPMLTSQSIHSQSDKNELAKALSFVCAMQQNYGKTAAEFEAMVEGICFALPDRPMAEILSAIKIHIRKSNAIPAAADIENIINPPLPKTDWPLYIELKKRLREGNVYVDRNEKQFVRNCEDIALLRQRGELENYQAAQQKLEDHSRFMIERD